MRNEDENWCYAKRCSSLHLLPESWERGEEFYLGRQESVTFFWWSF